MDVSVEAGYRSDDLAEQAVLLRGNRVSADHPSILSLHGWGGRATDHLAFHSTALYSEFAKRNWLVGATDTGGFADFGNADHVDAIVDSCDWLESEGALSGGVIALGASMGWIGYVNAAIRHPTRFLAGIGLIPGLNLQDIHDRVAGGEAALDAAYTNHAGFVAALPDRDPMQLVDEYAATEIPATLYVASGDTTCPGPAGPSVGVTDFAQTWVNAVNAISPGLAEYHVFTAGGHTLAGFDAKAVYEDLWERGRLGL